MKRNNYFIYIETPSGNIDFPSITPLPWDGSEPDFTGIDEPTLSVLQKAWNDFLVSGDELEVIEDAPIFATTEYPDWDGLSKRCITPDDSLFALYTRLTLAAMGNTRIAVAQARIETAILTIRVEGALAGGISLLTSPFPLDGIVPYIFTQEEKDDWNLAVTALGFSPLVFIN